MRQIKDCNNCQTKCEHFGATQHLDINQQQKKRVAVKRLFAYDLWCTARAFECGFDWKTFQVDCLVLHIELTVQIVPKVARRAHAKSSHSYVFEILYATHLRCVVKGVDATICRRDSLNVCAGATKRRLDGILFNLHLLLWIVNAVELMTSIKQTSYPHAEWRRFAFNRETS